MRVLVTGVNGQLGYDVVHELEKRGHEAIGVDIGEMDITKPDEVHRGMETAHPDAVLSLIHI